LLDLCLKTARLWPEAADLRRCIRDAARDDEAAGKTLRVTAMPAPGSVIPPAT
jgi:hypothetical protein